MPGFVREIKRFVTNEPLSAGSGESSIPFLKLIPVDKKKILVIGCGKGYEVKWLKERGFDAVGVTNNKKEKDFGEKNLGVKIILADMHNIPVKQKFEAIFASNVLEHSVAPFLALQHWRNLLTRSGWLVVVMPSKEWLSEYYHYSVLTHSQMKDLLQKAGFKLLAGPRVKTEFSLPQGSDIFYDLGRLWGHFDGYVACKVSVPKKRIGTKNDPNSFLVKGNWLRSLMKVPYNRLRVWYARRHKE